MSPEKLVNRLFTAKYREKLRELHSWRSFLLRVFLAYTFFCLPSLAVGWFYGAWQYAPILIAYSFLITIVLGSIFLFMMLLSVDRERAIISALESPDDVSLPPLNPPLDPLPEELLPQELLSIDSLELVATIPQKSAIITFLGIPFALLFMYRLVIFDPIVNGLTLSRDQHFEVYDRYISIMLAASLLGFVFCLIPVLMLSRTNLSQIQIDSEGVLWRSWRRRERMRWDDIRSIARFDHANQHTGNLLSTYIVSAGNHLLRWQENPFGGEAHRQSSGYLIYVLATKTRLPIRDLTPLAWAMAELPNQDPTHAIQAAAIAERARALLAAIPSDTRRRARPIVSIALSILLLTLPIVGFFGVRDVAQPAYLSTLPSLLHTRAPIFTDDLTTPNGYWPTHSADSDDYRTFAYADGGYMLSGNVNGKALFATLPQIYGSVAIEVTVREHGVIPEGSTDGVGFVLRHDPDRPVSANPTDPFDNFDEFSCMVNRSGLWAVTDGTYGLTMGQSDAILTTPGAANTMMIIERANFYALYVNDHLAGQYYDTIGSMGTLAQIGLLNYESGMSATFTNLRIWAINDPPNPIYV